MPVGPTDLAQLLMIEYASSYGNDWFVVPLTLPVGSLTASTRSSSPTASACAHCSVRSAIARYRPRTGACSSSRTSGVPERSTLAQPAANLFFLPPALGRSLQSPAVEDVLFMRDEMANVAWAIERSLESPVEQSVPRADTRTPADSAADTGGPPPGDAMLPRYLFSTTVPNHWIPLLPDAAARR